MGPIRWLATILIAIATPLVFAFLLAVSAGADGTSIPREFPDEGNAIYSYFGEITIFTSLVIWCIAPIILKNRGLGFWLLYGVLSPIFGGIFVAVLTVPSLLIHFHVLAFIILGFIIAISIPVGLFVGFLMFLIWRSPKAEVIEEAEQASSSNGG